mgnify:CR=1 FL=1
MEKKFTLSVTLTWEGTPTPGWTEQEWAQYVADEIAERGVLGGSLAVESLTLLSVTDAPDDEEEDDDL